MKHRSVLFAALGAGFILSAAAAAPAFAEPGWGRGHHEGWGGWRHERFEHRRWFGGPYWYGRGAYYAPPVYYAPPPVYYPGVNFSFHVP